MNNDKKNQNIPTLGIDLDNYSGNELLDEITEEEIAELEEQQRELQRQLDYERSKKARGEKEAVDERLRRAKAEAGNEYKNNSDSSKKNENTKFSSSDDLTKQDETKDREQEKHVKEQSEIEQQTNQTGRKANETKEFSSNNGSKSINEAQKKDVVGKNKEGKELTKPKSKFDKFNDQRKLVGARIGKATNTLNRARALKHEATHPLSTAGTKLGSLGAKAGKKAVSLVGKGVATIATKVIGLLATLTPLGLLFFVLILLVAILAILFGNELAEQQGNLGYYDAPCQEITVIGTSNHPDSGTFSVEDYVAGVVQNEVGFWNNLVVDEVFAIAARTYVFKTAGDTCTIENSTRTQTFTSNPGDIAKEAAMNTQGLVITDESGSLLLTQYDALAVKEITSTHYILKQKNQPIPKSWIESHINSSTLNYYANHNHGNGISQWGARYLAEQGQSSREIISYYIEGANLKNTFRGEGLEGVPDYPITNNAGIILRGQRLDQFLLSKGTSIEELNNLISANVDNAGRKTRAGVVTAAVTLIGEMNKLGIKLPYVFGGGHGVISQGASPSWGVGSGLDCSGFISWAIYNGGFSIGANDSSSFANLGEVVSLSDEPVLKPGDIIWRPRSAGKVGHVALVIGYDNNNQQYLTAEALGSDYGVLFHKRKFNASGYKGILMENYYNSH